MHGSRRLRHEAAAILLMLTSGLALACGPGREGAVFDERLGGDTTAFSA